MAEPTDLQVSFAALTDPGCDPSKAVNEDAFLTTSSAEGYLLSVCDGMGGHEGGRVASSTAIQILKSLFEDAAPGSAHARFLRQIIETAGRAVHALANSDEPEQVRPGSTCVAVLLTHGRVAIAHVGDSRAYRWRNGKLERLTQDHSIVNDLVMAGVMTPQDAQNHPDAHRITRALGMSAQVVVDIKELTDLQETDRFMLCSDGLTDLVSDEEIARILSMADPAYLERACVALIELAKQRGGHDNVTAVIAHVVRAGNAQRTTQDIDAAVTAATRRMPTVSEGAAPIAPTLLLSDATVGPAPTVVERAVTAAGFNETQPIALASSPTATMPSVPEPAEARPAWDTRHKEVLGPPRSSAHWLLIAAAITGLVIIGLLIWALVHAP